MTHEVRKPLARRITWYERKLHFGFHIFLCLDVTSRHVVEIASLPVNSLYVKRRQNTVLAASTKRLPSVLLRSLYRNACSSR